MMKVLLFTLVLGFGGLLSVMVGTRGVVGVLPDVDLPERFQPGQPLPLDAYCYWEHWSTQYLYCQADGVYLSFDQETRTIQRATKHVQDLTIGDLILVWGEPTGQTAIRLFGRCVLGHSLGLCQQHTRLQSVQHRIFRHLPSGIRTGRTVAWFCE
jgi:hypothetical protein